MKKNKITEKREKNQGTEIKKMNRQKQRIRRK